MDESTVRKYWRLFQSSLGELEETDRAAAESVMGDVSQFETDWWGGR